jgi:VWFA-related protein
VKTLTLALLLQAPAGVQAPAAAPAPPSFGVEVAVVYLDVFVTNAQGPVRGLTAADFDLRDDGVPRAVRLVSVGSRPLRAVLVLDTSASIDREKLRQLQAAGRVFLDGMREGDEVALLGFSHELRLLFPYTTDRLGLGRALLGILPGGATALYDGIYAGMRLASGRGRSLLVLFTDGRDNTSWLDAAQVSEVVRQSDVLLQVVATKAHGQGREQGRRLAFLRRIAEETGGRLWPADTPRKLAPAFAAIMEAMKTRYLLSFEPGPDPGPGLHRLELTVKRRRVRVQCRRFYFVATRSPVLRQP